MRDAIAVLEDVRVRFDSPAGGSREPLRGVSLSVAHGESIAITGPSGSGKTTLLQVLGAIRRPTSGSVRIDGVDPTSLDENDLARLRNEKLGFVFQFHHLLPQLSALENVLVPELARRDRVAPATIDRAHELLATLGMGDRVNQRPGELSGGECQRVAVARALILDPILVLADEPTGSLDQENAEHLADLLARLPGERGVSLVVVTHWPDLARRMRRTLRLSGGYLSEEETP